MKFVEWCHWLWMHVQSSRQTDTHVWSVCGWHKALWCKKHTPTQIHTHKTCVTAGSVSTLSVRWHKWVYMRVYICVCVCVEARTCSCQLTAPQQHVQHLIKNRRCVCSKRVGHFFLFFLIPENWLCFPNSVIKLWHDREFDRKQLWYFTHFISLYRLSLNYHSYVTNTSISRKKKRGICYLEPCNSKRENWKSMWLPALLCDGRMCLW